MNEEKRFGETDHEPLAADDILAQALSGWRDEGPGRGLGVSWAAGPPEGPARPAEDGGVGESEPGGRVQGDVRNANFADAQFNAAVTDLEDILRSERDRLDPRTVLVIERNLRTIDDAIREARTALDRDPANTYLNS